MANEILKLGYESGIALLARQDQTLGNVRNRATALFSATTVATSLAAAVGLLKGSIQYPAAVALIVIVVLVGGASLFIVWPVDWVHGPSPAAFPPVATTLDEDTFRSSAIEHLAKGVLENERKLRRRQHALEVAIVLLVLELVVVVFSL
jgi:hypothetical protein